MGHPSAALRRRSNSRPVASYADWMNASSFARAMRHCPPPPTLQGGKLASFDECSDLGRRGRKLIGDVIDGQEPEAVPVIAYDAGR